MIRMTLLALGLTSGALALHWGFAGSEAESMLEQVSRSTPDPMGLSPSLNAVALSATLSGALSGPVAAATPASLQAATAQAEPRTYTVVPGDSLPVIAFEFYGTTAAYQRILDANEDVVRDPAALRVGMVLTLPE